ncbi:hypothetical protein BVRB_2g036280 isoform A [Beta vulgaris subsp. vulgaris]|nr:hypothetical protein BVRB_2g036280 isoform A [Beta vulgaris subsp. vulgaris]
MRSLIFFKNQDPICNKYIQLDNELREIGYSYSRMRHAHKAYS